MSALPSAIVSLHWTQASPCNMLAIVLEAPEAVIGFVLSSTSTGFLAVMVADSQVRHDKRKDVDRARDREDAKADVELEKNLTSPPSNTHTYAADSCFATALARACASALPMPLFSSPNWRKEHSFGNCNFLSLRFLLCYLDFTLPCPTPLVVPSWNSKYHLG